MSLSNRLANRPDWFDTLMQIAAWVLIIVALFVDLHYPRYL